MNKIMEEELVPQSGDILLCVKVGKIKREDIYEMARKYWVVDGNRANQATHVLAIIDGIVDSVFINCHWKLTDNPQYAGRWEFHGTLCTDSPYIGKSVKAFYGRSSNPVKYINL